MATTTQDAWKRTVQQEVELRAAMVRGTWLEAAAEAVVQQLGTERARAQVPISGATNLVRRRLQVTATAYDYCAMTGLDPALALLCSDSSPPMWRDRLAAIGAAPIPSGLVEGGGAGGLRRMLEYLQTLGYCGIAVEWSERSGRPYVVVCRPDDLLPAHIVYAPDDPLSPVLCRWRRERQVDGTDRTVYDVWDLRDMEAPAFRVMIGEEDVTARCDALRQPLADGLLSGPGYQWRYADGRPYMPIVVYGSPGWVMAGVHLTEAALDALVFRTALKSAMIDAGFPTREVRGLTTGTSADTATGQDGSSQGPGDVRVWSRSHEDDPGEHWQFSAAVDPEAMYRVAQAQEVDAANMLGVPLDLTRLGGEPFAHALALQQQEAGRWYNILRSGDAILMRRIAALTNRRIGTTYPESGYSSYYQDELREALGKAERPVVPQITVKPDPPDTEDKPDEGEE